MLLKEISAKVEVRKLRLSKVNRLNTLSALLTSAVMHKFCHLMTEMLRTLSLVTQPKLV